MTLTPKEFRGLFPGLATSTHLASCSQGARSSLLDESLHEMLSSMTDQGAPWAEWMNQVEAARAAFARLIHASPDEVAILPNASIAAYQVISTMDLTDRFEIISSALEFPSVGNVWHAQRPRGASVTMLPESDGTIDTARLISGMSERTALLSVPLVTYRNGARIYQPELSQHARDLGVKTFVDAYQGAGVVPIDVRELNCDFLTAGTLKYLLGLPGLAFLYVRGGAPDDLAPQLTGWFGRENPFGFDPTDVSTPQTARRFETGTPAIPAAYAARAGLTLLQKLEPADVWAHVTRMRERLRAALLETGAELFEPEEALRGPMVAVRMDDPDVVAQRLMKYGVFTSPRGDLLRLSLHYYNTDEDVERLMEFWPRVATA